MSSALYSYIDYIANISISSDFAIRKTTISTMPPILKPARRRDGDVTAPELPRTLTTPAQYRVGQINRDYYVMLITELLIYMKNWKYVVVMFNTCGPCYQLLVTCGIKLPRAVWPVVVTSRRMVDRKLDVTGDHYRIGQILETCHFLNYCKDLNDTWHVQSRYCCQQVYYYTQNEVVT